MASCYNEQSTDSPKEDVCGGWYVREAMRRYDPRLSTPSPSNTHTGAAHQNCWEYEMAVTPTAPDCITNNICPDDSTNYDWGTDRYYANGLTTEWSMYEDEQAVKQEIFDNGPLVVVFEVFDDFPGTGVYNHSSGASIGWHAVVVQGWGNDGSDDYWLIKNSWGDTWHETVGSYGGYVKFLRSPSACCSILTWPDGLYVDPIDPECGKSCANGGYCYNTTHCACGGDWQGETCELCLAGNCENGGSCATGGDVCECVGGWDGDHCLECEFECHNGTTVNALCNGCLEGSDLDDDSDEAILNSNHFCISLFEFVFFLGVLLL